MLKYVMSLLVCACVMASPVLAGGGAKKDAFVKIIHDLPAGTLTKLGAGNDSLIVIANPSTALKTLVNGGTARVSDITAAGGVIVKVGRTAVIPVKSGVVQGRGAVVLPNANSRVVPVANQNFNVAKGQILTVKASTVPVAVPKPW